MLQPLKIPKLLLNIQLTPLYLLVTSSNISKKCLILLDGRQRVSYRATYLMLFLCLIVALPNHVFAKGVANDIPDNAKANSYGDGWSCNLGYRENKEGCAAVIVPANAYSTDRQYGKGWECKRGYLEVDGTCSYINVPKNGYLDYSGIRVKCDRGFLMINNSCEAIKVPANGYLEVSSYGPGWACQRGYRIDKDDCVALSVPENAHIGFSGNVWECNTPFIKRRNNCVISVKN